MSDVRIAILVVLQLFLILLIGRIVVEFIRSFARDWYPKGIVAVLLEVLFSITDPPVKLVRRIIPPLRLGQVRLDLSVMIVMIVIIIASAFVRP